MTTPAEYFDTLNQDYLAVHREKEDLFWTTYMGTSDDKEGFAEAETRWTEFISNANRLSEVRNQLKALKSETDVVGKAKIKTGLKGWLALFEANVLESEEAQKRKTALIKLEADLFEKRKKYRMTYLDEQGHRTEGSLSVLSANIRANDHEQVRKSSHQALLDLENKGFVTLSPRKGFEVRALSAKNIRDMFELRRALEKTVVITATSKLTSEDLRDLQRIIGEIEHTRDPIDFQKHDRAFHRRLAAISDNTYIINALNTVWDLSDWVGASILYNWGGYSQAAGEHMEVYEFMTVGDAEKAAAAMERHLNGTEMRFLEKLSKNGHGQ